jgi:hypothetical protein
MPSSYTSRLRLELQATGENRTTWGNKANNVFSRIEDAVAGAVTIAMGNTNKTLTTVNGSSDEARNKFIILKGAAHSRKPCFHYSVGSISTQPPFLAILYYQNIQEKVLFLLQAGSVLHPL